MCHCVYLCVYECVCVVGGDGGVASALQMDSVMLRLEASEFH